MKKLKSHFYWANRPCTKKFLVGEGLWFGLSNCGVGTPDLQSRRSLSSKARDVNMKHFAQKLTASLPREKVYRRVICEKWQSGSSAAWPHDYAHQYPER